MIFVPLTKGYCAIIDAEDRERVSAYKWCVLITNGIPYAVRVSCGRMEYLHRFIVGALDGQRIDHKSGNTMDCRKSNLRAATHLENNRNRGQTKRPTSSRYKGVDKRPTGWRAQIGLNRKKINLGIFSTEEDAGRAYDTAARKLFGEFARPNFPLAGGVA